MFAFPNIGMALKFKNFMDMVGLLSGLVCLNYCLLINKHGDDTILKSIMPQSR